MNTSLEATRAANRKGILAVIAAMSFFVCNDALIKHVSAELAGAQLIFIRGLFAIALLLLVGKLLFQQKSYAALADLSVLTRALVDGLATILYLTALFLLPLGNATAINMATPIFIALGAALIFKEKVSGIRWACIVLGFIGVMLVIQPRAEGFNSAAWLCLAATGLHALRDLLTRSIAASVPSIVVTMASAVSVTVLAGVISIFQGWREVQLAHVLYLALASVFLSAGYFFIVRSMRSGDMAKIAPFRYAALPIALLLGFVMWGEIPNPVAWIGIALLVSAGLVMLRR